MQIPDYKLLILPPYASESLQRLHTAEGEGRLTYKGSIETYEAMLELTRRCDPFEGIPYCKEELDEAHADKYRKLVEWLSVRKDYLESEAVEFGLWKEEHQRQLAEDTEERFCQFCFLGFEDITAFPNSTQNLRKGKIRDVFYRDLLPFCSDLWNRHQEYRRDESYTANGLVNFTPKRLHEVIVLLDETIEEAKDEMITIHSGVQK